jgi:hypothetical protein
MRYPLILLGVLILALGTMAQENSGNQFQVTPAASASQPEVISNDMPPTLGVTPVGSIVPATPLAPATSGAPAFSTGSIFPVAPAPPGAAPAPQQPGAVAVYESYSWQLAANYTFFHFYEGGGFGPNYNGVIFTGNYYFLDWLAGEGEIMGTWGNQQGRSSNFVFAGGGPRFRWSLPRNVELFGHALVGGAHLTPQTSFGTRNALGYVLGAGVDINAHHRRFAYRFGADMIGTRFFSSDQFSPRAYAGFVFKF